MYTKDVWKNSERNKKRMKTCKDCIHYYACSAKGGLFNEKDPTKEMLCNHFKDKLPCNVGDTVYIINRNKVKKCQVIFVGISLDKKCSYFNFVENYADGTFYKTHSMVFAVIGKTVFLTRKAAEQALKEREHR